MLEGATSAGSGLSGDADTNRAADEAAGRAMARMGGGRADWAVVFATVHHFPAFGRMLEIVSAKTGAEKIVGCSGHGVLTEEGEIEDAPGIAVLVVSSPSLEVFPFLERPLHNRPDEAALAIAGKIRPHLPRSGRPGNDAILLLPDTYHLHPTHFFASLEGEFGGVPLFGGGASEDGSQGRTYQFYGKNIESNAVVGMLMTGTVSLDMRMTQACRPLGEPRVVTRAEENVIYELGGRPALELFKEAAGEELAANLRRAVTSIFVGLPMQPDQDEIDRGQYLVRNIMGVDPDSGAIAISDVAKTGQLLTFALREPAGAREDLMRMSSDLQRDRPDASFGLYFNCMARGRGLYGEPDVDSRTLRESLKGVPVAGFFTGSEIAPIQGKTHLHQYSGILLLVSDAL